MTYTPESPFDRAARILEEAQGLTDSERAAFLKRACSGDVALRKLVDELLQAREKQGEFLANPTADDPAGVRAPRLKAQRATDSAISSPLEEGEGTRIGHYKLLQQIGEGGFGVVFMADQEEPVRRRVALKIIKLGMDTRQVVARFDQERQVLALMDHPNIARVLDAGSTSTGRPYFVMELVRGVPITEYCDVNHLSPVERLELFIPVCFAVQHAHQKGIIHRDIKPNNVLVTLHDGKPVPKIIDFGIAKATDRRLTEKTLFTAMNTMVGTPVYMSPEQAEMSGLDVDTRSDIYSLGVLLYELLTGTTPFSFDELQAAGWAEMRRLISEVEPARPSLRVSTLGALLSAIASKRKTEPKRLGLLLRGDLDWVVMKALEKDRGRRYDSATGLADDIQRHLQGEPVRAAPPSALYKLRKFVSRNRGPVAAFTAVTAALILGLVIAIWALRRTKSALEEESIQRHRAESAEVIAESARRESDGKAYLAYLTLAKEARASKDFPTFQTRLQACPPSERSLEWSYLDAEPRSGHLWPEFAWPNANGVFCSPDGNQAYAYGDEQLSAYDPRSRKRLWRRTDNECRGATPPMWCSPDSNLLCVTAHFGTCGLPQAVWALEAQSGKTVAILSGHQDFVNDLAFAASGKLVATASNDRTVRIWDVSDGGKQIQCLDHKDPVLRAQFNSNGVQVVTATSSGLISLWDWRAGYPVCLFKGHVPRIAELSFAVDGRKIVAVGDDGTVLIWDAETGTRTCVLRYGPVSGIRFFGEQCEKLLIAEESGLIEEFDISNERVVWSHQGGQQSRWEGPSISNVTKDGLVAFGGGLWDLKSHACIRDLPRSSAVSHATIPLAICSLDKGICFVGRTDADRTARRNSETYGWHLETASAKYEPTKLPQIESAAESAAIAVDPSRIQVADLVHPSNPVVSIDTRCLKYELGSFSPDRSRLLIHVLGSWPRFAFRAPEEPTHSYWALFDTSTGRSIANLECDGVAMFGTTGRFVAGISSKESVRLWRADDGTRMMDLSQGEIPWQFDLDHVSISAGDLFVEAHNRENGGIVWSIETGQVVTGFSPPTSLNSSRETTVRFSPMGTFLLFARSGELTTIVNLKDRRYGFGPEGAIARVDQAVISANERLAAVMTSDGTVLISDLPEWCHPRTIKLEKSGESSTGVAPEKPSIVCISDDGNLVATMDGGSEDLKVWSCDPPKLLRKWNSAGHSLGTVARFAADDHLLAFAGTYAHPTTIFDCRDGAERELTSPPDWDHYPEVSSYREPDSLEYSRGFILAKDGNAILGGWELASGLPLPLTARQEGAVIDSYGRDPSKCLMRMPTQEFVIADSRTGHVFQACGRVDRSYEGTPALCISGDGRVLLSSSGGTSTAELWDSQSGRKLWDLVGHQAVVRDVALSPDGSVAVTGSEDKTACVWSLPNRKPIGVLGGHGAGVGAVAVSPDATRVLTGSDDLQVRLWDIARQEVLATWSGHQQSICAAAFNLDGSVMMTRSTDSVWLHWPGESRGKELRHAGNISAAEISADGLWVATISDDGTAKVWDSGTGVALCTIQLQSPGSCVAFSADAKQLAIGSRDGSLLIRELGSDRTTSFPVGRGSAERSEDRDQEVTCVAFAPDASRVLTGSKGSSNVCVWDPNRQEEMFAFPANGVPTKLWIRSDARQILALSGGDISVWGIRTDGSAGASHGQGEGDR